MFNFRGRAPRSEYWWFFLFQILISIPIMVGFVFVLASNPALAFRLRRISEMDDEQAGRAMIAALTEFLDSQQFVLYAGLAVVLYLLIFAIPYLTVTVRRLHDINKRGWNIFMPTLAYFVALLPAMATVFSGNTVSGLPAFLMAVMPSIVSLGAQILFLVWLCRAGTSGPNRFGDDPLGGLEMMHPAFAEQVFGDGDVANRPRSNFFETKAEDSMVAVGGEVGGARAMAARKAAARDYYQRRVLPSIQKADPRPDY
ncbi:DUF805 domain-containing protein [Gymnodinialimonas sp. 2305UL16-5]|uniref:DUF805 domain-containing protein n=1 Tax=Gymnodinialimonas mytili TaxID=3126503 RepID=UPI0030A374C6